MHDGMMTLTAALHVVFDGGTEKTFDFPQLKGKFSSGIEGALASALNHWI